MNSIADGRPLDCSLLRDLLRLAQHAENVQPEDLLHVLVLVAALEQFRGQRG